jgi:glutathione S-transferase
MVPLGQVWVHTHPFTAAVATQGFGKQFTEFGEANRKVFAGACRVFDTELAARQFIAADRYTMADIVMQTTFDFGRFIGVDIADEHQNLKAWYARVSARPGATFNVPDNVMAIARQKKQ